MSVFFNCQFFSNRLISDFDFRYVDRHEWKKQGSLTGFLKKFLFRQIDHFGPENGAFSNSGSTVRIVLNFAQWKGLIGRWK